MIPEDSILRKIPWAFTTDTRLELQAIAFAIDAIYLRHRRILNWASKCEPGSFSETPHHERLELFLDLWSIVDQADVLRRLLKDVGHLPSVAKFLEIAKAAQGMRNCMDHLPQSIANIAAKKSPSPPVYGVFSFGRFYWDETVRSIEKFEIYSITAGSLTHKSHRWPIPNPAIAGRDLDIPVGMFEFCSFDRTLDVSALLHSLNTLVTEISESVERRIRNYAARENLEAEVLLADYSGYITNIFNGEIRDTPNPGGVKQ